MMTTMCRVSLCLVLLAVSSSLIAASFPIFAPDVDPTPSPQHDLSAFPIDQQTIRLNYLKPEWLTIPSIPLHAPLADCPCSNVSLCTPLTVADRPEIFIFQVRSVDWSHYEWSDLTTIAITEQLDPAMLCFAHAHSTRIVLLVNIPAKQLTNTTYRTEWINSSVSSVVSSFTDGLNVDFEEPLAAADAKLYTSLLTDLNTALHSTVKGSQLTVDVAWSPAGIDNRYYDALGIAQAVDFLFVMSYDLRSQIYDLNDCRASANSPIHRVHDGVVNYTTLGIKPSQLVLGVPWYGYDYPCVNGTDPLADHCPMGHVPFEGAPCSDAAGQQFDFVIIQEMLKNSTTGRRWNATFEAPFFNWVDTANRTHQVWFDDVESLSIKYHMAHRLGMRGAGMWTADFLSYEEPIPKQTHEMWQALKIAIGKRPGAGGNGAAAQVTVDEQ